MDKNYDDIINLPHHVSENRPHMSDRDRAAQFSPFSALTGYGEAVAETARITDEEAELDPDMADIISERLDILASTRFDIPVTVTYFVPDARKRGGEERTVTSRVKKVSPAEMTLELENGIRIPTDKIKDIRGDMFPAD